ncbi:MAG: DNA repair protein RadC [Planctomycetes bacterium]|nr:DNA repair protein RadC [Planctomycetota bacterium]
MSRRRKKTSDDAPAELYAAVRKAVRAQGGSALMPLLRRWKQTRSADDALPGLTEGVARFLVRYGTLDAGDDPLAQQRRYAQVLGKLSRSGGDAPGLIAAWLEVFAQGAYGVLAGGVCGDMPRCGDCLLARDCRYLAAGGRDERLSGAALAKDLAAQKPELAAAPEQHRNAELLAFLLTEGKSGSAAVARAEALLKTLGGVRGVLNAGAAELHRLGLKEASVAKLRAMAELVEGWSTEIAEHGRAFGQGRDFYEHFHLRLRDKKKERFYVACLDQKNRLIGEEMVSEGSLTEVVVHPREVFAPAVRLRAAAVAVVHNHPSGDPAPSPQDKALTKRLVRAAELVGIRLLDHVVIGDGDYISFVEEGLM